MQARSSARLQSLLDSTALLLDEVGIERLTTNMVAEQSGSSIGTLYRYFPDRIALLRGLALSQASLLYDDVMSIATSHAEELRAGRGLDAFVLAVFERLRARFRNESGWVALGYEGSLDQPANDAEEQLVSEPLRRGVAPVRQIALDVTSFIINERAELEPLSEQLASDIEMVIVVIKAFVQREFGISEASRARVGAQSEQAVALSAEFMGQRFTERFEGLVSAS